MSQQLAKKTKEKSFIEKVWSQDSKVTVLSVVLALVIGSVLIAFTNPQVIEAMGYFFGRPSDTFVAIWKAVVGAYGALLQGAIFNPTAGNFAGMIRPLTETLTVATPLIFAGLGITIAFRAGLFNIGAQGQIMIGALFATVLAIHMSLPGVIHLPLVIIAGFIGGALWGGIAGVLKAYTGAHEVILTIMLNYVATYLLLWLLTLPFLQRPGATDPISPLIPKSAMYPLLLGHNFRLHLGFLIAIAAVFFAQWLLEKSTLGFSLRAVGSNPKASEAAGINVPLSYVIVMALAGGFAGLAGVAQVSGTEHVLTAGIAASFGFDAITVALLGRSKPWGTFWAALLFGAFRAGGSSMQVNTGTPIDIVLVVQSLIVLFIVAPALVREIFKIKEPKAKELKEETA
ncbi:MAG: ABC transporter permease [Micrococcaceae bacterium]